MIVECHPKCKVFQDLPEYRFIVNPKDKLKEIYENIRKKVSSSQKQFATQSIFLFSQTKLLNIGTVPATQRPASMNSTASTKISRTTCYTCTSPTWKPSDMVFLRLLGLSDE